MRRFKYRDNGFGQLSPVKLRHRIWRRLTDWRQRAPKSFWLSLLAALVLTGGTVTLVFIRNYTFTRQLNYSPCDIKYGETVAGWDGQGEGQWDQKGYRYEVKKFQLKASAPERIFPNLVEQPPTRLQTSRLADTPGCQPDFSGLIDINSDQYQWFGAKAQAARLGMPDLGQTNNSGRITSIDPSTRLDKKLSPPLFQDSQQRAAAFIDDGGQAVLQTEDQNRTQLLWCQGSTLPLDPANGCNDVTGQGLNQKPVRGAGYLLMGDNCPPGLPCQDVDGWWKVAGGQPDADYSALITRNERGELKPFYLHLNAVSTHGYGIGTWMTLTFKYPKTPEVINQINVSPTTVKPGGTVELNVSVSKIGPDISSLAVSTDLTNQPLKEISGFNVTNDVVESINRDKTVNLTASYSLTGGELGKCYTATVNTSVSTKAPSQGAEAPEQPVPVTVSPLSARYCLEKPTATFSYEVISRGSVLSNLDEFGTQAAETLASQLGWAQAGVKFSRVDSGGDFTLVLASADQMTSFSPGCDATYSCHAGRFVVINDDRWRTATPSWNHSGGSLRDYRNLAINHEVGHWLGLGHLSCPAAGAPAPVMQQQSISLQGCVHNPWPTAAEISTLKQQL